MKTKLIIMSLLFSILGTSCGARKTQKSETKEDLKVTKIATEVKIETTTENTKIVDSSEIEEIEITPIDSTKEMVVDGKKYFNAKLKKVKRKNNIVVDKVVKVDKNEQKEVKTVVEQSKKTDVKNVERESWFSWWYIFWLILILYIAYRISHLLIYKKLS
jgi:hypothetical protein